MLTYEDEIEKQYCRFDLNFAPTDPTRTRIVGKMRERTKCRDHAAAYVGSCCSLSNWCTDKNED